MLLFVSWETPLNLHLYSRNYYLWMVKFFMIIILHCIYFSSLWKSVRIFHPLTSLRKCIFFLTSIILKLQAQQRLLPARESMFFPLEPLKYGWSRFCKREWRIHQACISSVRWSCKSKASEMFQWSTATTDCNNQKPTKLPGSHFLSFAGGLSGRSQQLCTQAAVSWSWWKSHAHWDLHNRYFTLKEEIAQ